MLFTGSGDNDSNNIIELRVERGERLVLKCNFDGLHLQDKEIGL